MALSRAGTGNLAAGGSDTITFVLSEASTAFSLADVDASKRSARLYIELDSGQAMRIGDVVVQGGGTLALLAANTYTGPTTISAGAPRG